MCCIYAVGLKEVEAEQLYATQVRVCAGKKFALFFSFSVTSFQGVCDCEFHVDVASLKWCVQILMVLALIKMPTLIIWHYFFFSKKKNIFEPQI